MEKRDACRSRPPIGMRSGVLLPTLAGEAAKKDLLCDGSPPRCPRLARLFPSRAMEDATSSTSRASTILMTSVGVQCCVRVSRGVLTRGRQTGGYRRDRRKNPRDCQVGVACGDSRPPFTLCPQRTSHHNAVSLVLVVNPDCNRVELRCISFGIQCIMPVRVLRCFSLANLTPPDTRHQTRPAVDTWIPERSGKVRETVTFYGLLRLLALCSQRASHHRASSLVSVGNPDCNRA